MKSKFISFILTVLVFLLFTILIIFGLYVYSDFGKSNIGNQVKEFASNITINPNDNLVSKVEAPQVLNLVSEDDSESEDDNVNYTNYNINKYFFNQLDDYSKIIYNALYTNKENMQTGTYQIDLGDEFSDLFSNENANDLLQDYYQSAIEAFTYDNPDVFYIEYKKLYLNIHSTTKLKKTTHRVFIDSGDYSNYLTDEFPDEPSVKNAVKQMESIRNYCIRNKNSNAYYNAKFVHDYLVENIEYDQTVSKDNIYNIYGALVNNECVCEGYAKAFKYLLDAMDVPCVIVSGIGTNSQGKAENHAWNYVQINNKWYAVDCTWDDPIIIGGGSVTNKDKYKYFLSGSKDFDLVHKENGQFTDNGKVFQYPYISYYNYND